MAIINGFKGTLDFYVHKGQVCVRTWPRYSPRQPTTDEQANQNRFVTATRLASQVTPSVRGAYLAMAQGTRWTWKDIFIRDYMARVFRVGT